MKSLLQSAADPIEAAANILRSQTPRPKPTDICRLVHQNSWHYFWERSIANTPLRAKAMRLWYAADDYKEILEEVTGGQLSIDPQVLCRQIVEGATNPKAKHYLECGHRSTAVMALARAFDIPTREVMLFSAWHETMLITHHVIEMHGPHGWEFHDPDYGFCMAYDDGRLMSVRAIVEQRSARGISAYVNASEEHMHFINKLFDLGFFSAAGIDDNWSNLLLVTESKVSRRVIDGRSFRDHWREVIAPPGREKAIIDL